MDIIIFYHSYNQKVFSTSHEAQKASVSRRRRTPTDHVNYKFITVADISLMSW